MVSAQTTLTSGTFHVAGTAVNGHSANNGVVLMNGTSVTLDNSAKVGASNGFSSRNGLSLFNFSTATVNGGSIKGGNAASGIYDASSGALTITGGTVTVGRSGTDLTITGSGAVNISGGKFTYTQKPDSVLYANGTGLITITGGNFDAGTPKIADIVTDGEKILVVGTNLRFKNGHIVGVLEDGEAIHATYEESDVSDIELINAPESSTLALLAGGLVPFMWIARRNRRKL